jgi:hypothetical protein
MNQPPLPQPYRFTCAHCGAGFNEKFAYCPNCGTPIAATSVPSAWKIVAQVFLCLSALCSGGFGACVFLLMGLDGGMNISTFFLAVIPILTTGLCIWGVFTLARQK